MTAAELESPPCNICGNPDYRVLRPPRPRLAGGGDLVRTFSSSSDAPLSYQLVACTNCGLQYVSPRLRAEGVLGGYAAGSDEAFVSQVRGREITFGKCLDRIERARSGPPGRVLDIGTGSGAFLHVARERGWQVEGCEPSRWLCGWARKHYALDVRPGTVFEQDYPSAAYDLVTLWDVLEHTPDPRREVREAARLIKPGGLLVINYPDIGSSIARLMGRRWVFLLDVHLYYFTRTTIRRLLEDTGFTVVDTTPHIQWLGARYILRRASPYLGAPVRAAARLAPKLGVLLELSPTQADDAVDDVMRVAPQLSRAGLATMMFRVGPLLAAPKRAAEWMTSRLAVVDPPVPYWIGQTLVIARKAA